MTGDEAMPSAELSSMLGRVRIASFSGSRPVRLRKSRSGLRNWTAARKDARLGETTRDKERQREMGREGVTYHSTSPSIVVEIQEAGLKVSLSSPSLVVYIVHWTPNTIHCIMHIVHFTTYSGKGIGERERVICLFREIISGPPYCYYYKDGN